MGGAGGDCATGGDLEGLTMVIRVTLTKAGRAVMVTHYRDVSADWLIAEWHGRLGFSVDLEVV